ncbi:MAG: universal stress protein [Cyclobacteriaceae bacterium]
MVREAGCPVITVKRRVYLSDLREIVFATNLREEEPPVMAELSELQQMLDARIHVLKVITANDLPADEADKGLMNNFIKKYRLRNCDQSFIHAATEEEGVIKFTSNRPNSIIALGTHGRKGLAHIISGSVAEDLAHHATSPVWTSHIKRV